MRPPWAGLAASLGVHGAAIALLLVLAASSIPFMPTAEVIGVELVLPQAAEAPADVGPEPQAEPPPLEPPAVDDPVSEPSPLPTPPEPAVAETLVPPPSALEEREPPPTAPSPKPRTKPARPLRSTPVTAAEPPPQVRAAAPAVSGAAAGAAPVEAAPSMAPDTRLTDNITRLCNLIVRYKPRNTHQVGTAHVTFMVTADGALAESSISTSSGSQRLDAIALDAVRKAAPFPPPPAGPARFSVPFHFE